MAGIVYLDLFDVRGQKLASERTNASTVSAWSVGWLPGTDTLILNSRDIGVLAWSCGSSGFMDIMPDSAVQQAAVKLHSTKYGH
jgi:hypothetical protein